MAVPLVFPADLTQRIDEIMADAGLAERHNDVYWLRLGQLGTWRAITTLVCGAADERSAGPMAPEAGDAPAT